MKKSNITITGAAALVALVAVTGIALSGVLADDTTATKPFYKFWGQDLTEEQKADIIAKKEEWLASKEEWLANREADHEKIQAAMEEGYEAWVAAVKEVRGEDCPMLEQITADNFDRFAEAHEHMQAAHAIFEELGIERGFGKKGMHGFGKKMGGFCNHTEAQ